jgi:anaerobic selenocysteine-containing dehydrogenase
MARDETMTTQKTREASADKTVLTFCPGSGCHAGCIHRTHARGGEIARVERLDYPDGDEGIICLKGLSSARLPYHPDRLKYPLKRAGGRGEGKWERITWEQALDEIAGKINEIREKYGSRAIAMMPRGNSQTPGFQSMLGTRLQNLLQATDLMQGMPIDSTPLYSNYFSFGTSMGAFIDPRTLVKGNTRYMICWGSNPAETAMRFMRFIIEARERGAKFVDIGLVPDATAKKADWWIPVKAGSDAALAMAMIRLIITERLYDEEYVVKYTNGPFLVRCDNGALLREKDLSPQGTGDEYVVWDMVEGGPRPVAPGTHDLSPVRPALLGTYEPGGIACKPAFQMLADTADDYRPETVERISGVAAEAVEQLAREYASAKPAAILISCGLRYMNSGNAARAIHTLGALTGNIGVMGGGSIVGGATEGAFNAPFLRLNDLPILVPTGVPAPPLPLAQAFQAMITGKPYPIKALLLYCGNLVHTFPNRRRWLEEILPNLELVVVDDIFMTGTAEYADYVLPDCTVFERDDFDIGYGGHIVFTEKAIEPLYECRPAVDVWSGLAQRLGLGEYFDKTVDEWMEFRLNSTDPSIAEIRPPLTLERLKKEKIILAHGQEGVVHPFLDKKFPTPSGRIEFYNEELVPAGDALPVFREQLESPRSGLAEKYPLLFYTANNKFFVHSIFANDPLMLECCETEPHLRINPQDAKRRNVGHGDVVRVYNGRGSCTVKASVTEEVPPGVVHLPHGWWPSQYREGHVQNLIPSVASEETRDEAREIYWSVALQRSRSRPGPPDTVFAYSPDTLSDCLCEVEKAGEGER